MAKDNAFHAVVGFGLGVALMVFAWSRFATDFSFSQLQERGLCHDGRALDEPVSSARFFADDSRENKGTVTMKCGIPVAAYTCFDDYGLSRPIILTTISPPRVLCPQ